MRRLLPLLLVALAGCATRPQPADIAAPAPGVPESTVARLVSAWQDEVCRFVDREGEGDPAVLSETRALHSRDVRRPARITFGVLDVEAEYPGWNGWDVQGVLVGRQAGGDGERYVFVVGIVARSGALPSGIQDIRLVGLSAQGRRLSWQTGPADPSAVQRYREAFRGTGAARFPGDADGFTLKVAGDSVSTREIRSGAEWSLGPGSGALSKRGKDVFAVLPASGGGACAR